MKNLWKGLIGLGISLLGLALWIAGSIIEGILGGFAGELELLTRRCNGYWISFNLPWTRTFLDYFASKG